MISYSIKEIKDILGNPSGHVGEWLQTEKGSAKILIRQDAPFIGVAAHAGSRVRPELLERMAVSPGARLFEEDPHTERFAEILPIAVIANDSRFEYDINRPPEKAVYRQPEDAWGLTIWKEQPSEEVIARSLEKYAEFHDLMDVIAGHLISAHGRGAIFDFHSFNRRCVACGPSTVTDWATEEKPEIDVCTARIDREYWSREIELWKELLGDIHINGVRLRVEECAVFRGGYLVSRMARTYGERLLHLVTEIKKIYMHEIKGVLFPDVLEELARRTGRAIERFTRSFRAGSS